MPRKLKPISARDTGAPKLPSLTFAPTGNRQTDQALTVIREHLEVMTGSRTSEWDRVVTRRDIHDLVQMGDKLAQPKTPAAQTGDIVVDLGGGYSATIAIKAFEGSIKRLQLYKDLKKRLDDPTRFDNLPAEVQNFVKQSLSDAASKLGTAITRTEYLLQEQNRQLAIQINQLTAKVGENTAGVRETRFATAEANFAQAGIINQLEASLGNYYQDGTPGRALLEEQMTVTADRIAGLSSQWTMKVQAGKSIAGIGLAATEDGEGNTTSAFIIGANKFAVVDPETYTEGLTNTPDAAHVPFGVDANGIYMNSNVYIKGNMRVDTGGKTIIDGLRGSLSLGSTSAWSDATARNLIYQQLGKGTVAPNNNHLVIGDTVTMGTGSSAVTRTWSGTAWVNPGVMLNGNLIVSGSISAPAINTNGLIIRDNAGNPILGAGNQLNVSYINGLGAMATQSAARIGSTVQFPDGTTMNTTDFVSRLSKISSANIGTFMNSAAIGSAYIGNAAVGELQIAGEAVTVPQFFTVPDFDVAAYGTHLAFDTYFDMGTSASNTGQGGGLMGLFTFYVESTNDCYMQAGIYINGVEPAFNTAVVGVRTSGGGNIYMSLPTVVPFVRRNMTGTVRVSCRVTSIAHPGGVFEAFSIKQPRLLLFGGKR